MKRNVLIVICMTVFVFSCIAGPGSLRKGVNVTKRVQKVTNTEIKAIERNSGQSGAAGQTIRGTQSGHYKVPGNGRLVGPVSGSVLSGFDSHGSLDSITEEFKKSLERLKSISSMMPKPQSQEDIHNDILDRLYPEMQAIIRQGKADRNPEMLLRWANYAKKKGDEEFVKECIAHVDVEILTPAVLYDCSKKYPLIQDYMPALTRGVAANGYLIMLRAKYAADCDSARMPGGDTLLIVADQYDPGLHPLVELSCFYDPSREVNLYKMAADSIVEYYYDWTDEFKEAFFSDFLYTLRQSEDFQSAFDYFESFPLNVYPQYMADLSLELATCAIGLQDNGRFRRYIQQAYELDSAATQEYWYNVYQGQFDTYIEDPLQIEMADWLLENTEYPADVAWLAVIELTRRYFPDSEDENWEWADISSFTPEQLAAHQAILYIIEQAFEYDNPPAQPATIPYLECIKSIHTSMYDDRLQESKNTLDVLTRQLTSDSDDELLDLRCQVVIIQSYLTGHGLDRPKEALKILKKNVKMLDALQVTDYTRSQWYDYMAALASKLGKEKEAAKYLEMKPQNT